MLVVARDELSDHSTSLLQILKAVDVEDLLLQDAMKAFDDPILAALAKGYSIWLSKKNGGLEIRRRCGGVQTPKDE